MFVRQDWLFALWWLAALRGLRGGEICALRWVDVDLHAGTLTVSRQVTRAAGRLHVGPPKTPDGQRTIALDAATVAVLREHPRRQRLLGRAAGTAWQDTGLVFTWPDGRPISPDWLTHRFHHLVSASGLAPVRLHDLRPTPVGPVGFDLEHPRCDARPLSAACLISKIGTGRY